MRDPSTTPPTVHGIEWMLSLVLVSCLASSALAYQDLDHNRIEQQNDTERGGDTRRSSDPPTPPTVHVIEWMLSLVLVSCLASSALAYQDLDHNRIDDRIDAVHALGWNAAFVNGDPTQRMSIGVESPAEIVFAVYVRYDHAPTAADRTALAGTVVSMVWPFVNIHDIESRATWTQIQLILLLPGVTAVEAVPVDYADNHYGSRVVGGRRSRGPAGSE